MPLPLTIFGLVAIILLITALTSGLVARAPVSFPLIFMGLGLLLGGSGLHVLRIQLQDPILEFVGTVSLSFVLFLDAINLQVRKGRKDWLLPALALGPGILLTIILVGTIALILLHIPVIYAFLIGAVLASVDPVLLRDVVRDQRLPRAIREALKTEAGASDVVVLPIILVLATLAAGQKGTPVEWMVLLVKLVLLGPFVGVVIGIISTLLIDWARSLTEITFQYRALYGIGVLLAAYVAGEGLGGSGFLSVFTAGLVVSYLDYDLCDCFLDYGEITSELAMLVAFLLFGVLLSELIRLIPLLPVLLFALLTLLVVRPLAFYLLLLKAPASKYGRWFIGWFGPRGLSSLLFGLLLVAKGIPNAELVLAVTGVVVILSTILHGVSTTPLVNRYARVIEQETLPEEREASLSPVTHASSGQVPRITPEELEALRQGERPPLILDVRSRSTYDRDEGQIPGSIRLLPDQVTDWAAQKPKDQLIVAYCT